MLVDSLVFETKGILEQPFNTSLLQSTFLEGQGHILILKKYQPEGWYFALVGRQGLEPRTKGL